MDRRRHALFLVAALGVTACSSSVDGTGRLPVGSAGTGGESQPAAPYGGTSGSAGTAGSSAGRSPRAGSGPTASGGSASSAHDAAPVTPQGDASRSQPDAASPGTDAATRPDVATPRRDATTRDASPPLPDGSDPSSGLRILDLPPGESVPAPHSDDCAFNGPTDLVPYNVLVPPAWEVEADGTNVYYTQRAQVACLPVPPSCQQQGTLERVPRCGGAPTPLALPFNGDVAIRAGGGKVYVRSSKDGFYRVDGQTGALDKMDIAAACVYGFAANATSVLVADTCGDRILRAPHTGTALTELRALPSVSIVGASPETAYAATKDGVFWVRLDTGASGKLITADAYFDLYQLAADARAVWLLYRGRDSLLRVARLPLDGSEPDVFLSAALNGVPTIAVTDGYAYFLSYTPPASTGALVRVPSSGGPAAIVAPSVVYTDVAAYGTRAYFTEQGAVRTAR